MDGKPYWILSTAMHGVLLAPDSACVRVTLTGEGVVDEPIVATSGVVSLASHLFTHAGQMRKVKLHNIALPTHKYVWLRGGFATPDWVPAVWYGLSATHGVSFGCHVLLESGANVVDLPLHALAHDREAPSVSLEDVCQWDAYGNAIEAYAPPYLVGLSADILTPDHSQVTGHRADLVCAIDHIGDGYSLAPDQHKHLWIGAREDGAFVCYPQDRYLVRESSFTKGTRGACGVSPAHDMERGAVTLLTEQENKWVNAMYEDFPKRDTPHAYIPARNAIIALTRSGVPIARMAQAVAAYRDKLVSEQTEPRYVKSCHGFFSDGYWLAYDAVRVYGRTRQQWAASGQDVAEFDRIAALSNASDDDGEPDEGV
jgi:hypothetical protein